MTLCASIAGKGNQAADFFLQTSFHSGGGVLSRLLGRKGHKWVHPALDPICYNTDLLVKMAQISAIVAQLLLE